MIDSPSTSGSAGEARLELAIAASEAERANRPRWIIVLGALLLAATAIYTLVQYSARNTMFGKIADARTATRSVQDLRAAIEAETLALSRRGTAPDPRAGQKIEELARIGGVALSGVVTDRTQAANSQLGMQQHVYTAKAVNQDPLAIFNWLLSVQSNYETSGLEITRLRLAPGAGTAAATPGWNVDLELARWEKLK